MDITKICVRTFLLAIMFSESACSDNGNNNSSAVNKAGLNGNKEQKTFSFDFGRQDLDVVGLRLGMRVDDAENAIRVHDNTAKINISRRFLHYRVGREDRRTNEYISVLHASIRRETQTRPTGRYYEDIYVVFMPPPSENLAAGVFRETKWDGIKGPVPAAYHDALIKKYGTPYIDEINPNGIEDGFTANWSLFKENQTSCGRSHFGNFTVGGPMAIDIRDAGKSGCKGLVKANVVGLNGLVHRAQVSVVYVEGFEEAGTKAWELQEKLKKEAMPEYLNDAEKPKL